MPNAIDIYEARANQGQHNGSLTVYTGPLMKNNWGNGFNVSYGNDVNLLNHPTVTGITSATGCGPVPPLSAISGMYDTRMDDSRYYSVSSSG
jgi:hypothetical protein